MKNIPKAGEVVELEMHIHLGENGEFKFFTCDMSEYGYGFIGKETIRFTVPEGNPLDSMVAAIEKAIDKEKAESHVRISAMKDKIQQLLAIGHDGGVV